MENLTIELTVNHIQLALYDKLFYQGWKFWLFNTYYFKWESDCLAFNDKGQTIEIEIKTSLKDFRADMAKPKHSNFRCRFTNEKRVPTKFYYACPWELIQPEDVPDYAGLIWVFNGVNGRKIKIVKGATILSYESANEDDLMLIIERSNQKMIEAWRKIGQL